MARGKRKEKRKCEVESQSFHFLADCGGEGRKSKQER
jgi:hypothetical protein